MIELVSYAFMEIFYFCKFCLTFWQYCIDFSIVNPARLVAVCSLSGPNITSCYRQKFVENPTHFQPQLNSFVFWLCCYSRHQCRSGIGGFSKFGTNRRDRTHYHVVFTDGNQNVKNLRGLVGPNG